MITLVLYSILLGVLAKDGLAANCPYNWNLFQDHCYLAISGYPESARSWYNAEDYCRSKNATLASILSSSEEEFVSKLVKPIMFTDDIWIGLHSLTEPGKYQWSDGSKLDYQIWDSNRLSSNKCVALRKDNGQWKDKNCGYLQGFVCKKPSGNNILIPPPIDIYVPTGNCPVTWYKYGQKCYKYFGDSNDERVSWKEAKQSCESLGENHFLVSIHNEHEQMFLTSMQAYHDYDTWIGLERSYTSKLEMWSDNSRFNYTNWIPGAGGYYWVTRCAKLRSSKKSAGKWDPVNCDEKLGYVCQRDPDPAFEPHPEETKNDCQGFTNYRNACYRLVKQRRSWFDAEKDCQQHQGHLVSINDQLEYAFLYNFVEEVKEELWIGLRTEKGSRMYSWSDGWPNLFLAWENRPKEANRPQCAYMNNSTRFWNVENCEVSLPYVCKTTKEKRPVIPIEKYTGNCPSYWKNALDFGGKYCYHIADMSTLSWGEALAYCTKQDSTLASFHSIYETELLWPLIGDNNLKLWLGLFKRVDDKFVWQDGSEVDFTNWFPSVRREGDCVYMDTIDMKWVQQACTGGYSHARPLCMKEKDRS